MPEVDMSEIRAAYFELRIAGDGLHLELKDGLRHAGEGAAQAVRAAAAWSTRIPAATSVQVSFAAKSGGVRVKVDASRAPEARPINHGGQGGEFRHPVWGHGPRNKWHWAPQAARPFFNAAGTAPAITAEAQSVLDHVAFLAGFK
jgi:hypothetical protein